MGFGGGGGGQLTNHVHNSVPLQGGPLDFANDTISSMNLGSTTFSDGAALQELLIGTPSQILSVNAGATAPEWTVPPGGSITMVDNQTAAGGESELTGTFTAIDLQTNASAMIIWKGAVEDPTDPDIMLRWNGISAAGSYSGNAMYMGAGNSSLVTHSGQDHMPLTYRNAGVPAASPNLGFAGMMYLYSYQNPNGDDVIMGSYLTNNFDGWQIWQCQNNDQPQTELDEFRIYLSSGGFEAGSQYTVYKITQ